MKRRNGRILRGSQREGEDVRRGEIRGDRGKKAKEDWIYM